MREGFRELNQIDIAPGVDIWQGLEQVVGVQ
jgi:hypothetical protein